MNKRFLISSDWHLRADRPRCRLDENWLLSQKVVVKQIVKAANDNDAALCIIGDLFHTPVVPPRIAIMFLHLIKKAKEVYIIPGNHDLPYHSWDNVNDSTIGIILKTNFVTCLDSPASDMVFLHQLVFKSKNDAPPNSKGTTAAELLDKYPDYKWIFTGDNHQSFIYEEEGRYVINPGCILRQKADLKNYQPKVFLIDTESEEVNEILLKDDIELVTDTYLRKEEERKERIEAFIEIVQTSGSVSLDFHDNLIKGFYKLEPEVVDLVKFIMEGRKTEK